MQKPDADGFVNITWPSRNVPHGGIFHARVVEPTAAQQEFLKVLLNESKFTIAQRRKSAFRLRQEEEKKERPPPSSQTLLVRPRTSRRRSLSAIRESGIFNVDPYKPLRRGEDLEKMKERLINAMAYGDSPEQTLPPPPPPVKLPPKLPTAKEQWNDLLTQIRERAEWLAEMEDLGHAGPHREIVKDQIAERLRALKALGIDSECSYARSGFSTLRSREITARSRESTAKSVKQLLRSVHTTASDQKQRSTRSSSIHSLGRQRHVEKEENVATYGKFTPLQYSLRRRV